MYHHDMGFNGLRIFGKRGTESAPKAAAPEPSEGVPNAYEQRVFDDRVQKFETAIDRAEDSAGLEDLRALIADIYKDRPDVSRILTDRINGRLRKIGPGRGQ